MVNRVNVRTIVDIGEDRVQCGEIRVDIGEESLPHQMRAACVAIRRVMTNAVSGHAPWNSADAFTAGGTADRVVRVKPNRGN